MRNLFAKNLLAYIFSHESLILEGKHVITIIGNDKEQKLKINNDQKIIEQMSPEEWPQFDIKNGILLVVGGHKEELKEMIGWEVTYTMEQTLYIEEERYYNVEWNLKKYQIAAEMSNTWDVFLTKIVMLLEIKIEREELNIMHL